MTPNVAASHARAAFMETGVLTAPIGSAPIVVRSRLFSGAGWPKEPIGKDRNAQGHYNNRIDGRNSHSAASLTARRTPIAIAPGTFGCAGLGISCNRRGSTSTSMDSIGIAPSRTTSPMTIAPVNA